VRVIEVGKTTRKISGAMRRGLNARNGGYRWPGCGRPTYWSEGNPFLAECGPARGVSLSGRGLLSFAGVQLLPSGIRVLPVFPGCREEIDDPIEVDLWGNVEGDEL